MAIQIPRGSIWTVCRDIRETRGVSKTTIHDTGGITRRPVIVVVPPREWDYHQRSLVVCATTSEDFPFREINVGSPFGDKTFHFLTQELISVSADRFCEYIGQLAEEEIEAIDDDLRYFIFGEGREPEFLKDYKLKNIQEDGTYARTKLEPRRFMFVRSNESDVPAGSTQNAHLNPEPPVVTIPVKTDTPKKSDPVQEKDSKKNGSASKVKSSKTSKNALPKKSPPPKVIPDGGLTVTIPTHNDNTSSNVPKSIISRTPAPPAERTPQNMKEYYRMREVRGMRSQSDIVNEVIANNMSNIERSVLMHIPVNAIKTLDDFDFNKGPAVNTLADHRCLSNVKGNVKTKTWSAVVNAIEHLTPFDIALAIPNMTKRDVKLAIANVYEDGKKINIPMTDRQLEFLIGVCRSVSSMYRR